MCTYWLSVSMGTASMGYCEYLWVIGELRVGTFLQIHMTPLFPVRSALFHFLLVAILVSAPSLPALFLV